MNLERDCGIEKQQQGSNVESAAERAAEHKSEHADNPLLPIEEFPIGQKNPPPETEEPFYYETNANDEGELAVGPFGLTAEHIKAWSANKTPEELNALVEQRQLRPSTAQTVKSDAMQDILKRLDAGEMLDAETIKKFVPGDLQRVIARQLLNK